jgi:hypothetical protein
MEIHHDSKIKPAFMRRDIRDVGRPNSIGCVNLQSSARASPSPQDGLDHGLTRPVNAVNLENVLRKV